MLSGEIALEHNHYYDYYIMSLNNSSCIYLCACNGLRYKNVIQKCHFSYTYIYIHMRVYACMCKYGLNSYF